jgi:hypothetical protein
MREAGAQHLGLMFEMGAGFDFGPDAHNLP